MTSAEHSEAVVLLFLIYFNFCLHNFVGFYVWFCNHLAGEESVAFTLITF